MAVDHCFSIKGQGTVMTGTILSGCVSIGDSVEIPALKVSVLISSSDIFPKKTKVDMQKQRHYLLHPISWFVGLFPKLYRLAFWECKKPFRKTLYNTVQPLTWYY